MAAVLVATGAFVYLRIGSELLASVDANLRDQLTEVSANAREGHRLIDQDASEGPTVAAVELPSGAALLRSPATLPQIPVRAGMFTTDLRGLRGEWRIAERADRLDGRPVVLVVGRSLAARDETLSRLGREFAFAAPAALLLAVLAGYGLAAAALRPVEAMRRRAAAVSALEPGQRLPVPPARDELQALAVTLNEMLARLEGAFEHERRFVSDASHELRTPLALLRAELELALRRPRSREELEEALHSAVEETERLSGLAEDLLLIARADQGRLPVRRERLQATTMLERVRDRFALRADALGRSLAIDPQTDPVDVDADPARIEQALGNLVANALEHGSGDVTLLASTRDGVVELHVLDRGPGIPDGFADRAFDRFSRADSARSTGGTGLGLSIVALVAQAHGGDARLDDRPGGGVDAWMFLPRRS